MYKDIVIESNTNIFDNMKVQGVCDGAAHQMRMIKKSSVWEADALLLLRLLHVSVFVLVWSALTVCCCFLSLSLSVTLSLSVSFCLSWAFSWINVFHSVAGPPLLYLTTCTSSFLPSFPLPRTTLISLSQYSSTLRMKPKHAILKNDKMCNLK